MSRDCAPTSYINFAGAPSGDFTVMLWALNRTLSGYDCYAYIGSAAGAFGSVALYTNGATLEVWARLDSAAVIIGSTLSANTWTHLAVVGNTGTFQGIELFKNGVSDGTGTTGNHGTYATTRTRAGEDIGTPLDGILDDFRVYSAMLTAPEILSAMRGGDPRPGSLFLHWPLWGNHSPEIDLSGNDRAGTLTGTTKGVLNAPRRLWMPPRPMSQIEASAAGEGWRSLDVLPHRLRPRPVAF